MGTGKGVSELGSCRLRARARGRRHPPQLESQTLSGALRFCFRAMMTRQTASPNAAVMHALHISTFPSLALHIPASPQASHFGARAVQW